MIEASVYIITLNEEQHIARALESVKEFNEVVVVDSGSTDQTLTIAKKYTDKVHYKKWQNFSVQKEYAKNLCANEWVLNLDADEEISQELKKEIISVIEENKIDGLSIKIDSKQFGKFNNTRVKLIRHLKFFRKTKGYYPPKLVHESVVIDGDVQKATGVIFDHGTIDIATHLRKSNSYSSLRAEEKFQKGRKYSLAKLMLVFPLAFCKNYFLRRRILNGVRGFIMSYNSAFYAFLKEAKLYELEEREKGSDTK